MSEEETGFDRGAELSDDDLVVLTSPDGETLPCVLLEVVEHKGKTYAVLTPQANLDDDEGDLLVATYEEDEGGIATFGPLDDEVVLAELQDLVGGMIGLLLDDGAPARVGGPIGEA